MFLAFCLHYQVAFFYKHKLSLLAHSPFSLWLLLWSDGFFFFIQHWYPYYHHSLQCSYSPEFDRSPSKLVSILMTGSHWFSILSLISVPAWCRKLILCLFCFYPGKHCLSKEPWFFLFRTWTFLQGSLRMLCMKVLVFSLPCNRLFFSFRISVSVMGEKWLLSAVWICIFLIMNKGDTFSYG